MTARSHTKTRRKRNRRDHDRLLARIRRSELAQAKKEKRRDDD
ncbi:MAG: hypothetical protein AB7G37_06425 [Solirubrobacteraceae bacterium]